MGAIFDLITLLINCICTCPKHGMFGTDISQIPIIDQNYQWYKAYHQSIKGFGQLVRFAPKKSARMVHHSSQEFNIVPSTREEVDVFASALQLNSGVSWETPITHLIKRMSFVSTFGDAYLTSGGAYLIKLNFWYHYIPKGSCAPHSHACVKWQQGLINFTQCP